MQSVAEHGERCNEYNFMERALQRHMKAIVNNGLDNWIETTTQMNDKGTFAIVFRNLLIILLFLINSNFSNTDNASLPKCVRLIRFSCHLREIKLTPRSKPELNNFDPISIRLMLSFSRLTSSISFNRWRLATMIPNDACGWPDFFWVLILVLAVFSFFRFLAIIFISIFLCMNNNAFFQA